MKPLEVIKDIYHIEREDDDTENDPTNETENDPIDEPENDPIDESENDSIDESENNLRYEAEYISSFNQVTLEEIRDVLYELHEYFDEFEIEVVACPCLTEDPFKLKCDGLSGNTKIWERHDPNYHLDILDLNRETSVIEISPGRNYFFSEHRPGMVLKMRAKGRKTNYNIITLIQNILHNRFSYKIGLVGILMINGGYIIGGLFEPNFSQFTCYHIDCTSKREIPVGAIVNDPIIIIDLYAGLFYTKDRYMFRFNSQFKHGRFVNDITPAETEYVGYFNIADQVTHI